MKIRLAVVASVVFASTAVLASTQSFAGKGSGFELDVVTCPDGSPPPDPSIPGGGCAVQEQRLAQPQPQKKKSQPAARPEDETLDIDLRVGDKKQTGPGGDVLELNLNARDPEGNIKPMPQGATHPAVSTSGGALGGASPFDFVTSDQALASFKIPPFLLPIYVSAGRAYNVPWNVLAAINQIETDFGRLGACVVSSAGAQGWMQFIPSTWADYGVDASGDGKADPCNPVDAIYAAARYLKASGAPGDMRAAIFSYNHADWYVDRVLRTASVYGALPGGLVTETGSLAFGRFPVRGPVTYGDDYRQAQLSGQVPTGLMIHPRERASAVATQNATVTQVLISPRLARAFRRDPGRADRRVHPGADAKKSASPSKTAPSFSPLGAIEPLRPLLRLVPARSGAGALIQTAFRELDSLRASGATRQTPQQPLSPGAEGLPDGYAVAQGKGVGVELTDPVGNRYRYEGLTELRGEIRPGTQVSGGQVLGPVTPKKPMLFSLKAAGGATVDPRPIVAGYRLQEAADYFHAVEDLDGNPFLLDTQELANGVLSGDQVQLGNQVLNDPGITIYPCGREDIQNGIVDKRVLGALLFLRRAGLTLTLTSLRCGHGYYTAGGSVSAHSYGAAVDIAAFNGEPVLGNQGPGSLTESAIRLLMQLQGEAAPAQLISLMAFGGASFALGDHADHLHVGYSFDASLGLGRSGDALGSVQFGGVGAGQGLTKPERGPGARENERRLSNKLGQIRNPDVPSKASPGASDVEGEHPGEKRPTYEHTPLADVVPSASGAEMIAIDSPAPGADQSYAIGTVAGKARGWAERQTVLLAQRGGGWKVVGPPVDRDGRTANPKLTELATLPGGRGYAVGEDGAVVELRGDQPPKVLATGAKDDLRAVDVSSAGRRVTGYAVGGHGLVLRLRGAKVAQERAGSRHASLEDVAVDGDKVFAVGSDLTGRAALFGRQASGDWRAASLELGLPPNASLKLESVAVRGGETWVGGSLAESVGSPLAVPFAARQAAGAGWSTYCSANPALSVVEELGRPTPGPCAQELPSTSPGATVAAVSPRKGAALVAAGDTLLEIKNATEPRLLAVAPGPVVDLAAISSSEPSRSPGGFALVSSSSLVRFGSGAAAAPAEVRAEELPIGNVGSVLAAAAGPDRMLALGGGQVAIGSPGKWEDGAPTGIAVRDAAWDGDTPWVIDELGTPLTLDGDSWTSPGEDEADREARAELAELIGGYPLAAPDPKEPQDGLAALAFSDGRGYAVGADEVLAYDGDWNATESAVTDLVPSLDSGEEPEGLTDVAAGPGGVIAVGDGGTLLELHGGSWEKPDAISGLTGGADLTAVAALDDDTMLAAGGGSILSKAPGSGEWDSLDLPQLGLAVREIAAVRADGRLTVLALVDAGEDLVLLRGAGGSWQPVAMPAGVSLSDLAQVPDSDQVLLTGDRIGRAVAMQIPIEAGG